MIEYLKTEGTCKCGLECPLFIHKVFNFDARIPSKLVPVKSRPELSQSGCKHCVIDYLDVLNPQQPSEIAVKQANDAKLPPFSAAQKRGNFIYSADVNATALFLLIFYSFSELPNHSGRNLKRRLRHFSTFFHVFIKVPSRWSYFDKNMGKV